MTSEADEMSRRAQQSAEIGRLIEALTRVAKELKHEPSRVPRASPAPLAEAELEAARLAVAQAMLAARRRIGDFFADELFADPARDMLLDLYVSARIGLRVSVSSACIASAVPATTALRWIQKLRALDLIETENGSDRRMVFVRLTDWAYERMGRYLDQAARQLRSALQAPLSRL